MTKTLLEQMREMERCARDAPILMAAKDYKAVADEIERLQREPNTRHHPWYWIQQYAVTHPDWSMREAVATAWLEAGRLPSDPGEKHGD